MPNIIKQHIAVIIRKHTEHGVPLREVVDELAKEYEELLNLSSPPDSVAAPSTMTRFVNRRLDKQGRSL